MSLKIELHTLIVLHIEDYSTNRRSCLIYFVLGNIKDNTFFLIQSVAKSFLYQSLYVHLFIMVV